MEDTGYEEYFYGSGVTLVEWACMIKELFPPNAVIVSFERDVTRGEDFRRIAVTCGLKPQSLGGLL
jgi:tRNA threonylcarbamoyladenosine biosynthesis protein TsaE